MHNNVFYLHGFFTKTRTKNVTITESMILQYIYSVYLLNKYKSTKNCYSK